MASLKHLFCLLGLAFCITSCFANELGPRLYIFGDSLFDAGNAYINNPGGDSGKPAYGMSTLPKYKGRYSDGLALPDFIALLAKFDDVMPPNMKKGANFSQGANFAYAGANVFDGTNDLDKQIARFKSMKDELSTKIGAMDTTTVMKKSVFVLSFGGVAYFSFSGSTEQKVAHVNKVLARMKSSIKNMYSLGARRFAFQNVMPLGCRPSSLSGGQCNQGQNDLPNIHNTAFIKLMKKLKIELSGLEYSIFDYFNTLGDRVLYPTKHGLKVGNAACFGTNVCKNPSEYVFWDGGHTTQVVHKQLAELFWSGGPDVVRPMNIQQLFNLPLIETMELLESVVA